MPDTFDLAALNSAITSTEFAGHVRHLASTPSTNDLAHEAARSGQRHGVWIADEQTAGRGRGGHTWHSTAGISGEPDGLYLSALITPPIPMQSAVRLSLLTAIAVQSAINAIFGFRCPSEIDIRWPNDLLLNGRKVAGILIEAAAQPPAATSGQTMLRHAVIGIGVNVNHTAFPPELDAIATSIRRESFTRSVENSTKCRREMSDPACAHPRESLAAAILIALNREIRSLTSNPEPRTSDLAPYSTWITGKRVRVEAHDGDPGYTGTTAGLNPNGFLLVAGDDGQLHTVLSGGLREP